MPVPVEEKEAFMEIIAKHVEDEMGNFEISSSFWIFIIS